MSTPLDHLALWRRTLAPQTDDCETPREVLRASFLSFRARVADLVSSIGSELPALTVHDITHLDALWRVAHEIAGDQYPINPAEAYVLGGAFLLHDAAHVMAAYPGRLAEIRQTVHWQDFVAQRCEGIDPMPGSEEETAVTFQVLRHLHAEQASKLPSLKWTLADGEHFHLIENHDLRSYYGDLIGEIAASHHWAPAKVAERFRVRKVSCPAFLAPAHWEVDCLKLALLLRTSDAAHLDSMRAPWFLFALRRPSGISAHHWRFQAKLGQPTRTPTGELRISSGASFTAEERGAWWLALDTVRMVDEELRGATEIMREEGRPVFAAHGVLGAESAESFARYVPVAGWLPVDVAPKISNVTRLIASLGGAALYGESYAAPLRELLQNGLDAVGALRSLGGIGGDEGSLHVGIAQAGPDAWWLSVTDTGIGMSRYVLANVLLDFGSSLWASDAMRQELPGLAKAAFRPIGKFGIGFFSVFMLGDEVRVTTRRYEPTPDESRVSWQLRFDEGLASRPALIEPSREEALPRPGTRVAVKLTGELLQTLLESSAQRGYAFGVGPRTSSEGAATISARLAQLVGWVCPASPVDVTVSAEDVACKVVATNDWKTISDNLLLARLATSGENLTSLTSQAGELLGRVELDPGLYGRRKASLVYGGIVCGQLAGLTGVLQALENNSDARRAKAIAIGTVDDWRRWATPQLTGSDWSAAHLLRVHPLFPELDLAVWTVGKEESSLANLVSRFQNEIEILLHEGTLDHDSNDDVGSDTFSRSFRPVRGLVCCPSFKPSDLLWAYALVSEPGSGRASFPWFLDVEPIDYVERFEGELKKRWGGFTLDDDEWHPVGAVDGLEITRLVRRYRRPEKLGDCAS